jgi:hypothetical protein
VRADRLVGKTAEFDGQLVERRRSQVLRLRPRRDVVIDMRVVAVDAGVVIVLLLFSDRISI